MWLSSGWLTADLACNITNCCSTLAVCIQKHDLP